MSYLLPVLLGAGALLCAWPALAAEDNPVTVSLHAGVEAAAPGATVPVLVRQTIAKGWHSYWTNPGDNGLTTSVDWRLPDGAAAGPLRFPVPERFQVGGVTAYGYGRDVDLLSEMTVPARAAPGARLKLAARVEWLACKEICIPGQAELELELFVAATSGPENAMAGEARRRLPKPAPWPVGLQVEDKSLVLTVSAAHIQTAKLRDAYLFPAEWGRIDHGAAQKRSAGNDGGLRLILPRDVNDKTRPERLDGVLLLDTAEGRHAYEISAQATATGAR